MVWPVKRYCLKSWICVVSTGKLEFLMLYFLLLEKISSWRSPTPIMAHPGLTWYRFLRVKRVLRVLEKRETSSVEARARDSRARGLVLRETNMATVGETCDSCVVKLDPKWHFLDLRNSNLVSIDNLTYSLTLGFIYGLNIHGCGMAEVFKILWGKLKLMSN